MARKKLAAEHPHDRRMSRINVALFVVLLVALVILCLVLVPRWLDRDVITIAYPVQCRSLFGGQTAAFPIVEPNDFRPVGDTASPSGSQTFTSPSLLLEDIAVTIENEGYTVEHAAPLGGGEALFITGPLEGGLAYYCLYTRGNGQYRLQQEAIRLGDGQLLFPLHLSPFADTNPQILPGQTFAVSAGLDVFFAYYRDSGCYVTELREDHILLSSYPDSVPLPTPTFPGPCAIYVAESPEGFSCRIELL